MRKRAEQVDQTRLRITVAAMRLHTTVGPANTTITSVAEEAGVTRLTVYRHFANEDELFRACSGHWFMLHPPPDPATWVAIPDVGLRAETALRELYVWFDQNDDDLYPIRRDFEALPTANQRDIVAAEARNADSLVRGSGLSGKARSRLHAAAAVVVHYWTWRTLVIEEGLTNPDAVGLAVGFLRSARS